MIGIFCHDEMKSLGHINKYLDGILETLQLYIKHFVGNILCTYSQKRSRGFGIVFQDKQKWKQGFFWIRI